jgi:4-amino-4-deoxy-L-arabinose transferase-like glycosyltransferase
MLPFLGSSGLWDPWEPKYAQTAREMAERGDWVVPHYREDPRLVKPPLTYWLIGASQSLLGVSELAARLPSALLALLAPVALALAFGCRGRPLEGWIAGAALLTSPQWLMLGRFATPDPVFASLLGLALATVIVLPVLPEGRRTPLAAQALVLVGLATLVEWPRGLLLPLWAVLAWGATRGRLVWIALFSLVCTAYYWGQHHEHAAVTLSAFALGLLTALLILHREAGLPAAKLALGGLLLALVVAPWFLAVFQLEPAEAHERLLGYKHGLNLGESVGYHDGPPWGVLRLVAAGALAWIAAALLGLYRGVWSRSEPRDELASTLAAALLGGLLFFSLSEAQMGHFYGVLQPPLAGLAGIGLVALARGSRWALVPVLAALAGLAALVWRQDDPSVILETATVKSHLFGVVDLALPALVVLGLWGAVAALVGLARRPGWAAAAVAPPLLFVAFLGWYAIPALGPKKSLRPIWERYVELRSEGEPIAMVGTAKESGFYYSNLTLERIKRSRELQAYLDQPGRRYVILMASDYRKLRRSEQLPQGRWSVLTTDHPTHLLAVFERAAG